MQLQVLNARPVLGTFSKAVDGSKSLSFGLSGGRHCDTACVHHPNSTSPNATRQCYAFNSERRGDRAGLKNKMKRHDAADPAAIAKRAINELRVALDVGPVPWFRISTNGSVPHPADASPAFLANLRELLNLCEERGVPVHFPVESKVKRVFYRKALKYLAVVRQSCQSEREFLTTPGAVSAVAGTSDMARIERVREAKRLAALRTEETGRKTIVCPAVASRYIEIDRLRQKGYPNAQHAGGSPRAKCGLCTACAEPDKDVIYPLH